MAEDKSYQGKRRSADNCTTALDISWDYFQVQIVDLEEQFHLLLRVWGGGGRLMCFEQIP